MSHHSSASAKQLASKLGLEKLRAAGDEKINSICTCRDELKEHLAPVREWKKEVDAQLKAVGKSRNQDDLDRSLDPYLGLPQGSAVAGSSVALELEDDLGRPKEREADGSEERLEEIMIKSYGYNPYLPEPSDSNPEEANEQETDLISNEDVSTSDDVSPSDNASADVDRGRTGLSPELNAMSVERSTFGECHGRPLNVEDLMALDEGHTAGGQLPEPLRANPIAKKARLEQKTKNKAPTLIDFSDDEDDDDGELIITQVTAADDLAMLA